MALSEPVLFYDGACGLCSHTVAWVLRWLRDDSPLRFAPLQGTTSGAHLPEGLRTPPLATVVLLQESGKTRVRMEAVRALSPHLKPLMSGVLLLIWPALLNPFYGMISRSRKSIFGSSCFLPTAKTKARFLP
jgi:predicted DCC family thiol-disulfide oxidoreductase YuxK